MITTKNPITSKNMSLFPICLFFVIIDTMDDNMKKPEENQPVFQTPQEEPKPIFESVPVEEPTSPEEVASDVTEPMPDEGAEGA